MNALTIHVMYILSGTHDARGKKRFIIGKSVPDPTQTFMVCLFERLRFLSLDESAGCGFFKNETPESLMG